MNLDGTFTTVSSRNQNPFRAVLFEIQRALFITRLQPGLVGNNPDLQKVHRLGLRRVVLAVADSSSGTHPLNITYTNYRASACAVFVRQGAFEHVGDDLLVPV